MPKKLIVLGISGSIAAVKAPELVRALQKKGFLVRCVMTPAAAQFVTPFVLSTLSGEKVLTDMFDPSAAHLPHIKLAAEADVFLIAPASAATLARCAHGLAEDMVSLTYMATKAPVVIAPAMHDTMWLHPATQENVRILKARGAKFIGPEKGDLADGSSGPGRMSEVDEIVKAMNQFVKPQSK